jgi:hypothetical protein
VSKQMVAQLTASADKLLTEHIAAASTESIKQKLRNLAEICRMVVDHPKLSPSISVVAREYKKAYPKQPLGEQTIRNRPDVNPYMPVIRAWQAVAHAAAAPTVVPSSADGLILRESDLHTIKDPTLKHQVTQIFAQNRSLHHRLNILKKVHSQGQIRLLDGPDRQIASIGEGLVLTNAELDSIRDFLDPRMMKAKQLKRSENDGISTVHGHAIADPGFTSALRKILQSYALPE